MRTTTARRWCPCARLLVRSLAPLALLWGAGQATAQALPTTPPAAASDKPVSSALSLMACRQIALEHQPAIRAAQLSLAAAADRAAALEKLHSLLARDLPIRREQSSLGVTIARAGVMAAEVDTAYGVTYGYLAAIYAGEQLEVARDVLADPKTGDEPVKTLKGLRVVLQEAIKNDTLRTDILKNHVDAVTTFLAVAEGGLHEAEEGQKRALTALREAMGGHDIAVGLRLTLPEAPASLDQERIIALAVARRPELVQAVALARVVALEADAQAMTHMPTARTFAAGSDIHVRSVPTGSYGLDYVPAAVAPEMPSQLVGCKSDRIQQAHDYAARADAVVEKTRNLIVLEAENAYLRWREKSAKAIHLKKAQVHADLFAKSLRLNLKEKNSYPHLDTVLQARLTARRLQVDALEARFQALLALAMLERVTAGGLCIDFDAGTVTSMDLPEQPGISP